MNEQASSIYKHSLKLERRTASLYVQNTGCQQCSPSYGWGPGVRNHFLLHHVMSGKGVFISRDTRYDLRAGDTFLAYPDTTIHYCADARDPWEYVWVGFGGLDAASYMGQTDLTEEEPVYRGRDSEEIRALLEMTRSLGYDRVICAFQPHTYSRTKALFAGFVRELKKADLAVLTDIFAAREKNTAGVSSRDLAAEIPGALYCPSLREAEQCLMDLARPGDLILTVGAGDIYTVGRALAEES